VTEKKERKVFKAVKAKRLRGDGGLFFPKTEQERGRGHRSAGDLSGFAIRSLEVWGKSKGVHKARKDGEGAKRAL